MSPLNFQDEHTEVPKQEPQSPPDQKAEERVELIKTEKTENLFEGESGLGAKFLWGAIIVIVIAVVGGGLYLLNRNGFLKLGGHKAPVTTVTTSPTQGPAQTPPPTNVTSPASQTGLYSLQVAAFKVRSLADKFRRQLEQKGIPSHVVTGNDAEGNTWFKVYTGSFPNRIQAIAAIENMKKKVGTDVWVVPTE